ncbi:MAG: ABC transporter ATP-binding protein [Desulfobacterales bacterium]|nr:ABC transporter ATP-binding protein [Desulfobacterales bacterium]
MNDVAIRAEGLGKRYRIGERRKFTTLRDVIGHFLHRPFRNKSPIPTVEESVKSSSERDDFIWALRDASFEIRQGEVVGIIGPNGAGKSTLLKILCRIIAPTEGRGEIRGRVASLLEVGTGFHPELTGRENVFLNGAILGMEKEEIRIKFDDIVAFSGVEKFIDTPVKHYSSGMNVRLAFAVAAHLEPENLLVDEVLAVGDAAFQNKCVGKMGEVARAGRTVLFVSHNMGSIRSLCDRVLWIDQGQIRMDGEASQVVSSYLSSVVSEGTGGQVNWATEAEAPGRGELKLRAIRLRGEGGDISSMFEVDKPIHVEICYEVKKALWGLRMRLTLLTAQGEIAFQTTDVEAQGEQAGPGQYRSVCIIPGGLLNVGQYIVKLAGSITGKVLLPAKEYLSFQTVDSGSRVSGYPGGLAGVVRPRLDWLVEKVG